MGLDGELALAALRMAIARRKPKTGCIHHSERGVHSGIDYLTPSELEKRVRKDPSNPDNRRFDLPLPHEDARCTPEGKRRCFVLCGSFRKNLEASGTL